MTPQEQPELNPEQQAENAATNPENATDENAAAAKETTADAGAHEDAIVTESEQTVAEENPTETAESPEAAGLAAVARTEDEGEESPPAEESAPPPDDAPVAADEAAQPESAESESEGEKPEAETPQPEPTPAEESAPSPDDAPVAADEAAQPESAESESEGEKLEAETPQPEPTPADAAAAAADEEGDDDDDDDDDRDDEDEDNEEDEDEDDVADESQPMEPTQQALLAQVDKIIGDTESIEGLIQDAQPAELVLLMTYFAESKEVKAHLQRVSLIKRSFDALKEKDEVEVAVELEERFSTALARFNKRRTEWQNTRDAQRNENLKQKQALVEELRGIVEKKDATLIKEVRGLQDRYKAIGGVPTDQRDALRDAYRGLLDQFYAQRKLYLDMRDYDRQINLKEKERLLEALKEIIPAEEDRENREVWQQKNDLLNSIQQKWKAVGHVPRSEMERINQGYRDITGEFFDLRSNFYGSQDEERAENTEKKEALLAQMREMLDFSSNKPREWNHASKDFQALQQQYKEVGPATRERNSELWKEFRSIGNQFFEAKNNFFRGLDAERQENLEKKRALVERAEALKDSTDFNRTARELQDLQREWKEIGPVPEKFSNKLWKRFRGAADTFFERRRKERGNIREMERQNLERKRALIEAVRQVNIEDAGSIEAARNQVQDIQQQWRNIGHVPYKEKDKIWEEFKAEVDQFYDDLRGNRDRRKARNLTKKVNALPEDKRTRDLKQRMQRLSRKMDAVRETVESYTLNINFVSKGKSGDALRKQIQESISREERLLEDLKKQYAQLDDLMKSPPKPEPEADKPTKDEAPVAQEPDSETVAASEGKPADKRAENIPGETATEVAQEAAAHSEAADPTDGVSTDEALHKPVEPTQAVDENAHAAAAVTDAVSDAPTPQETMEQDKVDQTIAGETIAEPGENTPTGQADSETEQDASTDEKEDTEKS